MNALTKKQEKKVIKLMAKEFLEERLGIASNMRNITRFAAHIIIFERWEKEHG